MLNVLLSWRKKILQEKLYIIDRVKPYQMNACLFPPFLHRTWIYSMAAIQSTVLSPAQSMNFKSAVPVTRAWRVTGVQSTEYEAQRRVSPPVGCGLQVQHQQRTWRRLQNVDRFCCLFCAVFELMYSHYQLPKIYHIYIFLVNKKIKKDIMSPNLM